MSLPSLTERAKNFAIELTKHALGGNQHVDDATYNQRLQICSDCDEREGDNCKLCGCNMPAKCWWKSAKCDDGKW